MTNNSNSRPENTAAKEDPQRRHEGTEGFKPKDQIEVGQEKDVIYLKSEPKISRLLDKVPWYRGGVKIPLRVRHAEETQRKMDEAIQRGKAQDDLSKRFGGR
jgi:hypothetical protein